MAQVKGPVCDMMVDSQKAAAKVDYKGQTYYFYAPGCKAAFDENPQKYLHQEHGGGHGGRHGHH